MCVSVCILLSGLIISDRDVIRVWQSFICHNWHLHPITFLVFFCFVFFCNLPSAGICGVSRRIHCSGLGIQRIQTRPQQLRQVERWKSCAHKKYGRRGEGKKEGGRGEKTDLLLWVLYLRCLADMLSDSEVRGDDCIDRFYSPVISEKETESRLEQ